MKRIMVRSVFDAFEYVMDHYYPAGLEEFAKQKDSYAVMSVQDSANEGFGFAFTKNAFCREVLTLYFDDIEEEVEDAVLFTEDMADAILDFVERNQEADTLLIHCFAGQSRSKAIGAFLVKKMGKDNSAYFQSGLKPNRRVLEILERAYEKREK